MDEDLNRADDESKPGNRGHDDRQHQPDREDLELTRADARFDFPLEDRQSCLSGQAGSPVLHPFPEDDPAARALFCALWTIESALRARNVDHRRCWISHWTRCVSVYAGSQALWPVRANSV